ncbi:MAG TPA: nickel pincer cofactor biosynthesis protein LarC [Thermoanaerobaculia bacterium]|nr:nickel pincer cofactor biosynthesis protein LarC [Thermoanaerobaculia bacterium]
MAIYHLDCASGLAGDMFLGACLDLGMPLDVVAEAVALLGLAGVTVESRKASRGGFVGTRFRVLLDGRPLEGPDPEEVAAGHGHQRDHHPHDHGHEHGHLHDHAHDHGDDHDDFRAAWRSEQGGHSRDLRQIQELLAASGLRPPVKERALRLFARLGDAEARAHGLPVERIHFHEVGAVDSIVDLVGAAAAIEFLAPERLTCGPVNVGSGRVRTAHGDLPVPAPATAELLRGVPIHGGRGGELTTPTGAVLLAELVDEFVEIPPLVLEATGYGLGKKEVAAQPNAVRLLRGRPAAAQTARSGGTAAAGSHAAPAGVESQGSPAGPSGHGTASGPAQVAVLECEVDNLSGEGFGFLMERLLEAGALDVYFTPVTMKKSRPGILVSVLCRVERLEQLAGILLLESGSLGCRYHMAARFEAERVTQEVETAFGTVRVKRGRLGERPLAAAPEFEDCRRLALAGGVPWREVYRAALLALAGASPAGQEEAALEARSTGRDPAADPSAGTRSI